MGRGEVEGRNCGGGGGGGSLLAGYKRATKECVWGGGGRVGVWGGAPGGRCRFLHTPRVTKSNRGVCMGAGGVGVCVCVCVCVCVGGWVGRGGVGGKRGRGRLLLWVCGRQGDTERTVCGYTRCAAVTAVFS